MFILVTVLTLKFCITNLSTSQKILFNVFICFFVIYWKLNSMNSVIGWSLIAALSFDLCEIEFIFLFSKTSFEELFLNLFFYLFSHLLLTTFSTSFCFSSTMNFDEKIVFFRLFFFLVFIAVFLQRNFTRLAQQFYLIPWICVWLQMSKNLFDCVLHS